MIYSLHDSFLKAPENHPLGPGPFRGDEARSDAEIISAAMDFDSALCRYATGRLHTDRSFLLKALRVTGTRMAKARKGPHSTQGGDEEGCQTLCLRGLKVIVLVSL